MKHNTCPNCGAAMGSYPFGWHCDYCGTEVDHAKVSVDKCFVDSDSQGVVKYAKIDSNCAWIYILLCMFNNIKKEGEENES